MNADQNDDGEQITADDVADSVISEPLPRDGQVVSNADKWLMIHTLLFGENTENEIDIFQDLTKEYERAYREKADDDLLALYLLADVQSDVLRAILDTQVFEKRKPSDVELQYHTSMLYYKKLQDKYMALDAGLTTWRHLWLH